MTSFKTLSKYSEDALQLAIANSLTGEERQQLEKTLAKIEKQLKDVHREKKTSSQDVLSDKFMFENEIVPKLLTKIDEIERREHDGKFIDLNINFNFNINFEKMKTEDLISVHHKLVELEKSAIDINLFIQYQRGKLYTVLKTNAKNSGLNFQTVIEEELHLCYRTVLRYILVAGIISKYPRLVLCGLNFCQILKYKNKLLSYFADKGKTLADRLSIGIDIVVQGTPISIHHLDVTIPKVSMPVRDDYQMSDKYDKSELPEKEISLLVAATGEQLLNSPDELDDLERYVNKL